ncbi:MAG TPA: hypothetical protein VEU08_09735 [Vicinamibacterales bacterium]|nr:hypothetical protein [Vicinamibacterales bacterium]
MEQRRLRKHRAQTRALAVCLGLRGVFGSAAGMTTVARLKRAVATQAARHADQERCRMQQKAAADRGRKARRMLYVGLRHVAHVSRVVHRKDDRVASIEPPSWMDDDGLIGRAEAILDAVRPHEALFVATGVRAGFFAVLAGEMAALRTAKDGVVRARVRYAECTAAIDRAQKEGDQAAAAAEGFLAASPGAPEGALNSFRRAKRIGTSSRLPKRPPTA